MTVDGTLLDDEAFRIYLFIKQRILLFSFIKNLFNTDIDCCEIRNNIFVALSAV